MRSLAVVFGPHLSLPVAVHIRHRWMLCNLRAFVIFFLGMRFCTLQPHRMQRIALVFQFIIFIAFCSVTSLSVLRALRRGVLVARKHIL